MREHYMARYAVDWESPDESKYKCPVDYHTHALRVYQNGEITIHVATQRQPQLRRELNKFGIDFIVPKDLIGVKLFTPDKEPIAKAYIQNDTILVDGKNKIITAMRRTPISYIDVDKPPTGGEVVIRHPRPLIKKKFLATWKDTLDICLTMFHLKEPPKLMEYNIRSTVTSWVYRPCTLDPSSDLDKKTIQCLGIAQTDASSKKLFDTVLTRHTSQEIIYPYILMEKK